MKKIVLFISVLLYTTGVNAQVDSTFLTGKGRSEVTVPAATGLNRKDFNRNRLHHSFALATPVAAVGFALMPADKPISKRVQKGMPDFHSGVDDYLRFVPLATQLTMSLGGVEGRSGSRWQVVATDAMAGAMMVAMTGGLKYTINRTRPNGEEAGFPSGHTATAFMGATLLSHEFGHKSLWFPVAGYSVATATAALRILNNKHYASDVLVGAAVGILSAELAYWATDAIFKDRKIFKRKRARQHCEVLKNY